MSSAISSERLQPRDRKAELRLKAGGSGWSTVPFPIIQSFVTAPKYARWHSEESINLLSVVPFKIILLHQKSFKNVKYEILSVSGHDNYLLRMEAAVAGLHDFTFHKAVM
jgi:hypothetical protein